MDTGAKISVIVPIYNTETFLKKCVDSILAQTYRNLEIILVNDGSTDGCGKICEEYKQKDNRIVVLHKENGGQSTARNKALEIATGDYIGFVDSDDYIDSRMYELLYRAVCETGSDMGICKDVLIYDNTISRNENVRDEKNRDRIIYDRKQGLADFLTRKTKIGRGPCNKLISKAILDSTRFPVGYVSEDYLFVYELLEKANKIVYLQVPLYYYFQREGSTSHAEFSERTKGVIIYSECIYKQIVSKHTLLIDQATYFYYSRIMIVYSMLVCLTTFKEYKAYLFDVLAENKQTLIKNPYFSLKEKVKLFLILSHVFPLVKRWLNRIRHT